MAVVGALWDVEMKVKRPVGWACLVLSLWRQTVRAGAHGVI